MESLLAVDLGLRTGLALYEKTGRLLWYRSKNFGSRDRLRRGVHSLIVEIPNLAELVLEGDRALAQIWQHGAKGLNVRVRCVRPEVWRSSLLYQREHTSGPKAKQSADEMARRIIEWSGAPRPTSLRHDAAEAILIGLWGVLELGWLKRVPTPIRK